MDSALKKIDVINQEPEDLKFRLSDKEFMSWYSSSITKEDAYEFVYIFKGTNKEARFVCALDYFNRNDKTLSNNVILEAYCISDNIPVDYTSPQLRMNAQYLFETNAVHFLLDRVKYRAKRNAEEELINLSTRKIKDWFERADTAEMKDDKKAGMRLEVEKVAVEAALRFSSTMSKERQQDIARREKKSIQEGIERAKQMETEKKALPSESEAKQLLIMLATSYKEQFQEWVKEANEKHR